MKSRSMEQISELEIKNAFGNFSRKLLMYVVLLVLV